MDSDFLPPSRGRLHGVRRSRPAVANKWQPSTHHTTFRTPEAVAASQQPPAQPSHPHQSQGHSSLPGGGFVGGSPPPAQKGFDRFKQWIKSRTKKQWIIIALVGILVLGAGAFAVYHFFIKEESVITVQKKKAPPPEPQKPITAKLTGLPIPDASINERPVTAVMIENSPDARPQAGLSQAGIVYEAVAEGGITRFLTLFQDTTPDYIGPVRSVRPYYVSWLMGYDAAVAHVGGSADALAMIRNLGVKDLDQFANTGPYRRVSNRVAPHNMYSDVGKLRDLQVQKGFTSSKYTPFERKEETKNTAPTVTSIDLNISSALYNPHYDYDAASNSYKRSLAGKPHNDERTGQLSPKVVVVLTVPQGRNGIYSTYATVGSGEAHIFQDGTVTKATWNKASDGASLALIDAAGAPIKLNPGQTWITAIGTSARITYK